MLFGVDAGGTKTALRLESADGRATSLNLPSINPAVVGSEAAERTTHDIFHRMAGWSTEPVVGWIGSASVTASTLPTVERQVRTAAAQAGVRGRVVLSEDPTILLLAPPLHGDGIVAIVGTGAITIAADAHGRVVQRGGYEYLVADEGSGFDLGLQGLRAAARAYDHRGPDTAMLELARHHYGADIPDIGVTLAGLPFPKEMVAQFARLVCEAADGGDAVASALIADAVRSIDAAVTAARQDLPDVSNRAALGGSLAGRDTAYSRELRRALARAEPDLAVHLVPYPVDSAFDLARRLHAGWTVPHLAGLPIGDLRLDADANQPPP